MKILIPSYLPTNENLRQKRYESHKRQLDSLSKCGLINDVIVAYNNYRENNFIEGVRYIPTKLGLNNALQTLISYGNTKKDKHHLIIDDDILLEKKELEIIVKIIDESPPFDIISIHEFSSPYSNTLTFKETFMLCNSAMIIKNKKLPDYSKVTDEYNPSIEYGAMCQNEGLKCFRIYDSDFLTNLCPGDSTINSDDFNLREYQLHKSYEKVIKEYKVKENGEKFEICIS